MTDHLSSKKPPPEQSQQRFTSNMCAVLNDPRKDRNKINYLFTKTWGSDFTDNAAAQIPKMMKNIKNNIVLKSEFDDYLKGISLRHTRHVKSSLDLSLTSTATRNDEKYYNLATEIQINSDIEQIPKIFFDPNFSLENKETFDKIISFKLLNQMNRRITVNKNVVGSNLFLESESGNPFLIKNSDNSNRINGFVKNDNKSELLEKVGD